MLTLQCLMGMLQFLDHIHKEIKVEFVTVHAFFSASENRRGALFFLASDGIQWYLLVFDGIGNQQDSVQLLGTTLANRNEYSTCC